MIRKLREKAKSYPYSTNPKLRFKIYSTVIVALLIGGAFFGANDLTQRQTVSRLTLLGKLGEMKKLELELQSEVLHNSFYLYHSYDRLNQLSNELQQSLQEVRSYHNTIFSGNHPVWEDIADQYQANLKQQQEEVDRFLTANATIKNSSMYIPILTSRYLKAAGNLDLSAIERMTAIAASVYLAKNGLDQNLVDKLRDEVSQLKSVRPTSPEIAIIQQAFRGHLQIFIDYFPAYAESVTSLLSPASSNLLAVLHDHIATEDNEWSRQLHLISFTFLCVFLTSIGMIIYLLLKIGRENQELIRLQTALTEAATIDRLTNLPNRFAFDSDIKEFERPLLYLINIDDFKHVNDLFGSKAGDFILTALAEGLVALVPEDIPHLHYRLGGDDFGILFEEPSGFNRDLFAQLLLEAIENRCFQYQRQTITISIAIGISSRPPLLETADMALNQVKLKKKKNLKYLCYSDSLNIQENIAHNFQVLNTIRYALENDGVLPAFQPIIDNRTGKVAKYECLIRIRAQDGSILAPGNFLEIARESSLYTELTHEMIRKCFQAFRHNDMELSINISVTDILDDQIHDFIDAQLQENPGLAQRTTFEILESEGIENYDVVHTFIRRIKAYGCHFAADDFGAGYSNFAHLLQLEIDILKIDASLIKHLDTDENARILVMNIADFCRKLQIVTVAEFVHSEAVLQIVREIGIDYSQGFHLGKPRFELPET